MKPSCWSWCRTLAILFAGLLTMSSAHALPPVTPAPPLGMYLGEYYVRDTSYATVNTFNVNLGYYDAGTLVTVSTVEQLGYTLLRLYDYSTGEHLAVSEIPGTGPARISYRLPVGRTLRLAAGCSSTACGGVIVIVPGFGSYRATGIASAPRDWQVQLGTFKGGITVQIGTRRDAQIPRALCNAEPGVTTYLLLKDADSGELLAESRGSLDNICAKIVYTVPFERNLRLDAGCSGNGGCGGKLDLKWSFDSMGSLRTDPVELLWDKPLVSGYKSNRVNCLRGALSSIGSCVAVSS